MTLLKDSLHLAQFDETRTRVLPAEWRIVEAEKTARAAVRRLEQGDELSSLSEALATHGTALAQLNHPGQAQTTLERAIEVAEKAGDFQSAGVAALAMIEQLGASLPNELVTSAIDRVDALLETTWDPTIVKRLAQALASLFAAKTTRISHDWTNFSFKQSALEHEAILISRALDETGGSVTKAARLLGFKHHQSLICILTTRHQDLLAKRSPVRPRRHHLMTHPKRK